MAVLLSAAPASAQLDPLLFLKATQPNVILLLDNSDRMLRDAPTDPNDPIGTSNYYDPFLYVRSGKSWEATLQVSNGAQSFRRRYNNFKFENSGFSTTRIEVTGDDSSGYATFEAATRMSIARAALYQAVSENKNVARFGLNLMRQLNPAIPALEGNASPVANTWPSQSCVLCPTDDVLPGSWKVTRPTVTQSNGTVPAQGYTLSATSATANADVLAVLSKDVRMSSVNGLASLLPAGNDAVNVVDAPVKNLLEDAKTHATNILTSDLSCRNTVAVLVVGGGEGNTSGGDPTATASTFTNILGHRVPIYVIAIAPPAADVPDLQLIAANSGGQYFEITKANIDAALASPVQAACTASPFGACANAPAFTVVVPKIVNAINLAVQHAFQATSDINAAPTTNPYGPLSEFQTTSPIIGTVNLAGANDIGGNPLTPDPATVLDRANNVIPQRSNLLVTTGFSLPGFDLQLRGFRVYKAEIDQTQPSGWKFKADGTRLWVACAPGTLVSSNTGAVQCAPGTTTDQRNLFTALPDGTMIAFTVANAPTLASHMNLSQTDAISVINTVRNLPLGAIVDSTPAIMNAPSLDPPPDDTYPVFAVENKDRRTIIFAGTNRGIFEAIDARLGTEVWGFIPYNLLPKLRTLRDGQSVGSFDYFADGSPKVADIKRADGTWRTYLVLGEGPGGTFYQTLDVTLAGMTVSPTSNDLNQLLTYFNDKDRIPLVWSYPLYSHFDPTFSSATMPYGDLNGSATAEEKTVGQSWSDPAVGQVVSNLSPYVVLSGSGFLPHSTQQQANRGAVAGTTFYMFNINNGALLATKDVGSDNLAETGTVADNCTRADDCTKMKNALQSDPVATGPSDSRFITKAYMGDLDGRVWRFDIGLDASNIPEFVSGTNPVKLYDDTALHQPIFASMATVNVGGSQQYIFFGTGSDLLPSNGQSENFRLIGVLDNGASGTVTFNPILLKVDGAGTDEKVTAFPAVAGDIVFFTTTVFNPSSCTLPTANLYALTFIGGPAYDTNEDNIFNQSDTTLVKAVAGVRATAPFIVDQHLVFGAGGDLQMFGDPNDFNNGIGQAGVRILSWREVR